ncbi:MAG: Qat anti-phage system associated protein QatB [Chitinophagaceae bacterium]
MGTSASGSGASGGNPLIPSWIDQGGLPPSPAFQQEPPAQEASGGNDDTEVVDSADDSNNTKQGEGASSSAFVNAQQAINHSKRFQGPRTDFNKYISSGGSNSRALRNALRNYSRNASGGTQRLARRMQAATSRMASFYDVVDGMRQRGAQVVLREFNLETYQNKPIVEILSAFSDIIFTDTGKIYEDTQDDSIVRQAYSDTIIRISEIDGIDLDNLTNEQVEVMMAIFVEETIVHRVLNDIGNGLTEKNPNVQELVRLEENIYQVVSGLVRNHIMPEVIATNRGDKANMDKKIENIYRQAFDVLAGLNN